jgi:hypothetical protein
VQPEWTLVLGEMVLDIQPAQIISSDPALIVLGKLDGLTEEYF